MKCGNTDPRFFLSYARADLDKYLMRFFSDLRERAARLMGIGTDEVAFIDY
jgi:hypothetical protein